MSRPLLLVALCAALAFMLAAPGSAQSPGPTGPCQLDGFPSDTTCGEDGGYVFEEPGGGYFAPIGATTTASASASGLPETGGPPMVLWSAALVLISCGGFLTLRMARHS